MPAGAATHRRMEILVGVAHPAQHGVVGLQQLGRRAGGIGENRDLGGARLHLGAHDVEPGSGLRLRQLELEPFEFCGDAETLGLGLLLLLPFEPGHAHQHLALRDERIGQRRAVVAQRQLAHLVGMAGAARLDDRQRAVPLPVLDDVRQVDPGVGDGRDPGGRLFVGAGAVHQRGVQHGDTAHLQVVEELLRGVGRGDMLDLHGQRRQRIDHQTLRPMLAHLVAQRGELILDVRPARAGRVHLEQARGQVRLEPDGDRGEIADDLRRAFVEADIEGPVAALAGGDGKQPGQRRLGGAGRTRDQDVTAAVVAAAQHGVQSRQAGGHSLVGDLVDQLRRSPRRQLQAMLRQADRKLVADEARAAILHHAHVAERRAVDHLMAEHDDAIDHELKKAGALVRSFCAGLLGDDSGQPGARQPVADAIQFAALEGLIVEQPEQHVDAVEDDARRLELASLRLEHAEHPGEVELAGLHHVRRQARVHEEQLLLRQRGQIPAEGGGVGDDVLRRLLESDNDARLLALAGAVDQGLQREHRLAAAGPADHQRRPAGGQAAAGDFVEAVDAGGNLGDGQMRGWCFHRSRASRTCRANSVEVNGFCTNGRPRSIPALVTAVCSV